MSSYRLGYVPVSIRGWFEERVQPSDFEANSPRPVEAIESSGDQIQEQVLKALDTDRVAWRTPEAVSDETGIPPEVVRAALSSLGKLVRRPYGSRPNEQNMYRLKSRGMTRGELIRMFRDALTRG
jgi:hypothetical protein